MKKLLLVILAFGSVSAFAQVHPWFKQHDSTYSLAKSLPHLGLVKSVYKDNFKTFRKVVSNELGDEQTFESIKGFVLSKETNPMKVEELSTPVLLAAKDGKAHYASAFKSIKTGKVIFTVDMTCVDKNLPPLDEETHGEYVYYAAQDVYSCSVTGIR